MSSIYTGVAGMQATQKAVDVIANNIANINTVAFKASRVVFEEALSHTLRGASATGINPQQVGMGVGIASIDLMMTDGTPQSTGRTLDLAVIGNGYFVVTDGVNQRYTRDGAFQLDGQNNLVMGNNGMNVVGWTADPVTQTVNTTAAPQGNLNIALGTNYSVPTSKVQLGGNLDANGTGSDISFEAYDTLGSAHQVNVSFTKDATTGEWGWTASSPDGTIASPSGAITFDSTGHLAASSIGQVQMTLTTPNGSQAPMTFSVDFSGISKLDGDNSVQTRSQDGQPMGVLEDYSISADGQIFGTLSNGVNRLLGQIALAQFNNPSGLIKEGENLWNVTSNSGEAAVQPASDSGSSIRSGSLEMSNVDLATEFANLIVTQRSFQANSRSVTTSDEMLQDVLQLKR